MTGRTQTRGTLARGLLTGVIAAGLAACAPASGEDSAPDGSRPGLLARLPDGRQLNFRCRGHGGPVVIYEAGWGADSLEWVKTQALTARHREACAYDRAGYGFSDPGPAPRDAAAIADDLEAGLKAAHIPAPYILVGHSAGGLYVRLFAARHPAQVAAMVLVDPSVDHQDARFNAVFGPGATSLAPIHARTAACLAAALAGSLPSQDKALERCVPSQPATPEGREITAELTRPTLFQTELSELDTLFDSSSDEVVAAEPAQIPQAVVVLTAAGAYGADQKGATGPGRLWAALHDAIAARSARGASRMVEHTSHMIMLDRPDAVSQAIDDVATSVRTPTGGTRR